MPLFFLSVYGAVAAICDEYENHQDRTGQPVILVGQSIVLGILQQYIQQVRFHQKTN